MQSHKTLANSLTKNPQKTKTENSSLIMLLKKQVTMEKLLEETLEKVKGMSYSEYELFVEYLTRQVKHNLKLTN